MELYTTVMLHQPHLLQPSVATRKERRASATDYQSLCCLILTLHPPQVSGNKQKAIITALFITDTNLTIMFQTKFTPL